MPRNSSGVYALPASNPVVPFTTIATSWANPTLSDIGAELTNSLDRTGRGGMLAPFRIFDGSVSQPGLSFLNDPTLGFYRPANSTLAFAANGADLFTIASTEHTSWRHINLPVSPTAAQAVRKDYVDAADAALAASIASVSGDASTRVLRAGDTMTGHLGLPVGPGANQAVRWDAMMTNINSSAALKVAKAGDTMSGRLSIVADAGTILDGGLAGQLEIQKPSAGFAGLSFHIAGLFGSHLGIDTTLDNNLRWGGWSNGASAWRVVHEGLAAVTLPGTLTVAGVVTAQSHLISNGATGLGGHSAYLTPRLNIISSPLNIRALPAASGTYDNAVGMRLENANVVLDFGQADLPGPLYSSWIQARVGSSLGTVGPIILNPVGGGVGCGIYNAPVGAFMVRALNDYNFNFSNQGGLPTLGCLNNVSSVFTDWFLHASFNIKPLQDNVTGWGSSTRRWNAIWAVNGAIQTSDIKAKTDIKDSALGLDFINSLRPISYKWIVGRNMVTRELNPDAEPPPEDQYKNIVTPLPGVRTHYGLIAQEVAVSVQASGVTDFGGYVDPSVVDDANPKAEDQAELGLRYDEFIAPIIKAIQELSAKVDALTP